MSQPVDRELEQWIEAWKAPAQPSTPPEAIYRYVQRRSRMLRLWLVVEVAVVMAVSPLLVRTAASGDAVERIAMGLLASMAVAALGFSWWNWRGAIRASGETVAASLDISRLRLERLRRATAAGWALLGAEVLVLTPWLAYRLYGRGDAPGARSEVFSWGLLIVMTVLGVLFLLALTRWTRLEERRLDTLRTELGER